MNSRISKYDTKSILGSVILIVIFSFIFFYWDVAKIIVRAALEHQFTYFMIWIIVCIIFVLHYRRLKKKEMTSEVIITKKFGDFVDNALGGVVYAISITTALRLLKGLFIQQFFTDKVYFAEFNDLDLVTILGLMLFLLYYSIMKVREVAVETFRAQQTEQVLPEKQP